MKKTARTAIKKKNEIEENYKKFRDVFDQTNQFMGLLDPKGNLIEINKYASDFIGLKPKDVLHKPFWKIPIWESSDGKQLRIKKAIQEVLSRDTVKFETTAISKDGSLHYIDLLIRPIKDKKGKVLYLVSVGHDISSYIQQQEDLKKTIQAKFYFTNMVSHELRTPLSVLKESLSLILDNLVGAVNSEQREMLEIAKHNVDRLSRLINNVLDFQKLESGKMIFVNQKNDLNQMLQDIGKTILPLVNKKKLALTFALDARLPKFFFDHDRISEVLLNLVDNAVKFTEKGKITISSELENHNVHVTIQDTGIGIAKNQLDKLFQEYEQLQRKSGGTGLGLAICKKIIESHKGRIWITSSEKKKGSTVHFTIPLKTKK